MATEMFLDCVKTGHRELKRDDDECRKLVVILQN